MTACSMTHLWRTLAVAAVLALCWAPPAEAQFETPNRQFHNDTPFRLDGRHRDLPCASCHQQQGNYKGTPTRCFDCHWVRRQDDRYRLQLGSRCEQCHRTASWTEVRWDHGAMTRLPLGAAHRQLTCQSCHRNNTFRSVQTGCFSCHQQDYQNTRAPNHAAAGFSTTCESCHRVDAPVWTGAVNHSAVFPLVGRHAQTSCDSCHINNVHLGTPRDCVGCHRAQYDRTTAPSHVAAGFATTCEGCHRASDASWNQATFNHRFPIASGPHRTACATCHQGGTLQVFTCLVCHEHDRTRMDDKHKERPGYRYDSLACYSCHPNGRR